MSALVKLKDVKFKSGDKVVYPTHGVGQIKGEEVQNIAGNKLKLYVVEFAKDKMILRVPVSRVRVSGLRALSSGKMLDKVIDTLRGRAKSSRGMWSRRAQEYEAKINSGSIISVSEVVRDLHKNVDDPDRSYSERVIYEAALGRLASEFAAIKNLSVEDAVNDLVHLMRNKRAKISAIKSGTRTEEFIEEEIFIVDKAA